jgi:hypothetical protein
MTDFPKKNERFNVGKIGRKSRGMRSVIYKIGGIKKERVGSLR